MFEVEAVAELLNIVPLERPLLVFSTTLKMLVLELSPEVLPRGNEAEVHVIVPLEPTDGVEQFIVGPESLVREKKVIPAGSVSLH